MSFDSFKCLVINHYDGSVVEAYRLSQGDSYRLQLRNQSGSWSWRFSNNEDKKFYASRESALIACVSYLFKRILQLSAVMQMQEIERAPPSELSNMPSDERLPTRFKSVDSLELHGKHIDFIDILKSENRYYAFYSNSTFSGPYPSENELLKHMVKKFSDYSDSLISSINKINCILACLDL